jgi:hypothetical protein
LFSRCGRCRPRRIVCHFRISSQADNPRSIRLPRT